MRGYEPNNNSPGKQILNSLTAKNITTQDMNDIKRKSSNMLNNALVSEKLQHYSDDWTFRDFFKRAGVMNDSIAAKCDEVSKQIRP